jgi:hypothetical protein
MQNPQLTTEDPEARPSSRWLRADGTYPPLAGADPVTDEETEGTPAGTAEAPEQDSTTEPPALPFSLDDIPETLTREEARDWLLARQGQMQSGITKVVQESREAQRRAEQALTLQERLANDATRADALKELAGQYGVELDFEDDGVPADFADDGIEELGEDEILGAPPEVVERLERVESRFAEQDQREFEQRFTQHSVSALEGFAQREGIKAEQGKSLAESIPAPVRDAIIGHAVQLPRLEGGLLDMDGAIAAYDQVAEVIASGTRASYRASKDTPEIQLGGADAVEARVTPKTQAERLALAQKIAQRHL